MVAVSLIALPPKTPLCRVTETVGGGTSAAGFSFAASFASAGLDWARAGWARSTAAKVAGSRALIMPPPKQRLRAPASGSVPCPGLVQQRHQPVPPKPVAGFVGVQPVIEELAALKPV